MPPCRVHNDVRPAGIETTGGRSVGIGALHVDVTRRVHRGGEDEPATLRKLGKRVSAIRFAYLGCPTARVRSRSVQDLSPSDSDLSQLGWRRGSHSGFKEGDSRRSDRRPGQAKPQVTRVIGVFDPYKIADRGDSRYDYLLTPRCPSASVGARACPRVYATAGRHVLRLATPIPHLPGDLGLRDMLVEM